MKQLNLKLEILTEEQKIIKNFLLSLIKLENQNFVLLNTKESQELLLSKIKNICNIGLYFNEAKYNKANELVYLFEEELDPKIIANFYFHEFVENNIIKDKVKDIFEKYENLIDEHLIQKKMLSMFNMIRSYSFKKIDDEVEKDNEVFLYHVELLKKYILNNQNYIFKDEYNLLILHLVKYLDKSKYIECILTNEEIVDFMEINHTKVEINKYSSFNEYKVRDNTLLSEICLSEDLNENEKIRILKLYNKDINVVLNDNQLLTRFFNDINKYKNIEFGIKQLNNQTDIEKRKTILKIANCNHISTGIGIRLACYYLTVLNENFENGKYLLDNTFFSVLKDFNEPKLNHLNGLDFLMAYSKKKEKTSVTIATKLSDLNNVLIRYEKEKIKKNLGQLELSFEQTKKVNKL